MTNGEKVQAVAEPFAELSKHCFERGIYRVGFYNTVDQREDETEFTAISAGDLQRLYRDFCAENHLSDDPVHIRYIDPVATVNAERLLEILRQYVSDDVEGSETENARRILCDLCGCTKEELELMGLDWIIPED